ncbi:MAG TPA: MATE family efflux transporter, partial [Chitinophagales bacterium]|nr:MATE family efflux transporter [Chitinophagales bacterium]
MELKAVYKDIWKLGYPIMVGSLAQNLIGATDMIILGWVGETEFAASGLISTFYLILVMIGFAISRGGQILISRRIGAGNYHQAGFWVRHLMYLELGMALVLFLTIFFFSRQILALFITNKDIYEASLLYLDYRIFGLFFSCLSFVYMALYTSIGRTGIIAVITIALFIINAGLNYL